MNFLHAWAIVLRNLILFRRSFPKLLGTFGFVTFDLFVWGFLTIWVANISEGQEGAVLASALLMALVFWDFFIRIQHSFSIAFLEDIWSRNIVNVFASPVTIREFVVGFALLSVVQGVLSLVYIGILASLFFALNILSLQLTLVPVLLSLFIFGWALGLMVIGLIVRFGPSAEILAFFLPFFFLPLSAVFYPIGILPSFIQPLALALPTTHVFEGVRTVLTGGTLSLESAAFAVALSIAYFALGLLFLAFMLKVAKAKGLIVRLLTD